MNLQSIARYQLLKVGQAFEFPAGKTRRVVIEILTTQQSVVELHTENDGSISVAVPAGSTNLKFTVSGSVALMCSNEISFYTPEFNKASTKIKDAVKFTKPYTPQIKNPELQQMEIRMMQNTHKRIAMAQAQYEQQAAQEARRMQAKLDQRDEENENLRKSLAGVDSQKSETPESSKPQEGTVGDTKETKKDIGDTGDGLPNS